MRRAAALLSTVAVVSGLTVVGATVADVASPATPTAGAAPVAGGLGFVALATPCRAVDTRAGGGALVAGAVQAFQVAGSGSLATQGGAGGGCGVPDGVGAVELAVTTVSPQGNGFLRAGANDGTPPTATIINYTTGVGITNTVTVPLAAAGTQDLSLGNFVGTTQVVVDVLGYFTTSTGDGYVSLAESCRAVDTRTATLGRLGVGASRNVQVAGPGNLAAQGGASGGCSVPDGVAAVEVSVSAVAPSGNGFLRAGPNSGAPPAATVVNYTGGTSVTNTGAVPLAVAGTADLTLLNFGAATDVTVDVLGYFTSSGGSRYQTVTPCRAVDTRSAPGGRLLPGAARLFQVGGERGKYLAQGSTNSAGCGIPQQAAAVEAAVTAVAPESNGFTRIGPATAQGGATFLNFTSARAVTNAGIVGLAPGGLLDLTAKNVVGTSGLVVDVLGYYEPTGGAPLAPEDADLGEAHSCYIGVFGTVRCWGDNSFNTLGDGSFQERHAPAQVDGIVQATSISASGRHTCVVLSFGVVRCWGFNADGQLGDGTTTTSPRPVTVAVVRGAVSVAAGSAHTCALGGDGVVRCWGLNDRGQLGDGTTTSRTSPAVVTGLGSAVAITAGASHTCALLTTGAVKCWGLNLRGAVGDGTTTNRLVPTTVAGLSNVTAIDAGLFHSCALLADGTARCWGAGDRGQLGNGTVTVTQTTPLAVTGLTGAVGISIGNNGVSTCASFLTAAPKCWGRNQFRQLGDGTATDRALPTEVVGALPGLTVVAGTDHTCGFGADGRTALCWGSNGSGNVGNGSTAALGVGPTPVLGLPGASSTAPVSVTAGGFQTCASKVDGTVRCWGYDDSVVPADPGHLRLTPQAVGGLTNVVSVDTHENHTCALLGDGTVKCLGFNSSGQVGDGTFVHRSQPVAVVGLTDAVGLDAGPLHNCAVRAFGRVRCWGNNSDGQLGNGQTTNSNVPVDVSGISTAVAVVAGGFHSCALLESGTVSCWGANSLGQLGNGTTTPRTTPITVPGLSNVAALAADGNFTCAVLADGTVKCWGRNNFGQLGDGSTTDSSSPVLVTATGGVVDLAAGIDHVCAVRSSGGVKCWGRNLKGALGDGTSANSSTSVDVTGISGVVAVAGGATHSCSFGTGAAVRCWGGNDFGALGIGSLTDSLSPVQVNLSS